MRLRAILFAVGGARAASAREPGGWPAPPPPGSSATTGERVGAALDAAGQDWVEVELDGLKVTLTGAAPDETSRFRTLEIVRQLVDDAPHRRRHDGARRRARWRRRPSRSSSCATRPTSR